MLSTSVQECLSGTTGSHIRPLLWYGGESVQKLIEEIRAVKAAGCQEFILENRGGDWFNTGHWWNILGKALETAQELQMRLWLLDDSHVNTGSANDTLANPENAAYRPQCLRIEVADFPGPVHSAIMLPDCSPLEKIITAVAYRRDETTGHSISQPIVLTDRLKDGLCMLELPKALWRIYFIMTADPSRQGLFANYITMLSRDSCRHLIDEIHEKCHQHFAPYFGNTFAGFFSDEPAFGNCDGQYGYDSCDHRMGQLRRLYPWWPTLPGLLAKNLSLTEESIMAFLPALWDAVDGISERLRIAYMDVITDLWRKNFSQQIGQWCEEHHVEYIGHALEDRGAHFHTGWGCGHFFRAMAGQHMAGMDIVLNQIVPGFRTIAHASNSSNKEYDSVFYHYTLAKLGASLAHQTPHMHNRSNCEVFGAYGWTCGLPTMRAIFNHFLASGTNNFMPHAYSMHLPGAARKSAGEETKAPPGYCMTHMAPTFYMGGMNPQYPQFGMLMRYVQRVSHLISAGIHQADVAVFYPAEADWAGCVLRPMDEVAACLSRHGIDFDFVPSDTLYDTAEIKDGQMVINGESYNMLVIPMAECLPKRLLDTLGQLALRGLPVVFTDALPSHLPDATGTPSGLANCLCIPLAMLPQTILERCGLKLASANDDARASLRFYGVWQNDGSLVYLLYNDGMTALETTLSTKNPLPGYLYDPWKNKCYNAENTPDGMRLKLESQQLLAAVFTPLLPRFSEDFPYGNPVLKELSLRYDIAIRETGEESYRPLRRNSEAVNLLVEEHLTRTCADYQYDTTFTWDGSQATILQIPHAGDFAEIWLNGQYCGMELGPCCRFQIENALKPGVNTLRIHTADNPSYLDRNGAEGYVYGRKLPMPLHGFLGTISIGH